MQDRPLSCRIVCAMLVPFVVGASGALGQSVLVIPAEIPQYYFGNMRISGDGTTVFGARAVTDPTQAIIEQPWRWSATRGVVEPVLPSGTNIGFFSSWTASGDRSVMLAYDTTHNNSLPPVSVLVDAAGNTQPFASPLPGYSAGTLSGDGRTVLFWQDAPATPGQGRGFAVSGPAGTRVVGPAEPTWHASGASISFDGSVVAGISSPVGGYAQGAPHLMRWAGGATAGGPVPAFILPTDYTFGSFGGVSGDGNTLFGGLSDSNFVYHPYLFTESGGFEFLPTSGSNGLVMSVSFDASVALIANITPDQAFLWRRGIGSVTIADFFASQHVDLAGFSDLRIYDMSYDGRVFVGSALSDGVYVPLLITVPEPGIASFIVLMAVTARRRR